MIKSTFIEEILAKKEIYTPFGVMFLAIFLAIFSLASIFPQPNSPPVQFVGYSGKKLVFYHIYYNKVQEVILVPQEKIPKEKLKNLQIGDQLFFPKKDFEKFKKFY